MRDLLLDACPGNLVRDFGDHDVLAVGTTVFDECLGPHEDVAAAGRVGPLDRAPAADDTAVRKVRALDVPHDARQVDGRVLDKGDKRIDNLAQVVRRNARRHAHGNPGRAVAEEIGKLRRQYRRLVPRLLVVRHIVDRVLFDVGQHLHRRVVHPRLGVSMSRGRIAVQRAEVPLPVHQRVTAAEVLGHADKRRVDRLVSVRMVVAAGIADDLGALAVFAPRAQVEVVHRHQDPALRRLQPVLNSGQRARNKRTHRVAQIRLLQVIFDADVANAFTGGSVGHVLDSVAKGQGSHVDKLYQMPPSPSTPISRTWCKN